MDDDGLSPQQMLVALRAYRELNPAATADDLRRSALRPEGWYREGLKQQALMLNELEPEERLEAATQNVSTLASQRDRARQDLGQAQATHTSAERMLADSRRRAEEAQNALELAGREMEVKAAELATKAAELATKRQAMAAAENALQAATRELQDAALPGEVDGAAVRNVRARIDDAVAEVRECVVCKDADRTTTLEPCRHMCVCSSCAQGLQECPICREAIRARRRARLA